MRGRVGVRHSSSGFLFPFEIVCVCVGGVQVHACALVRISVCAHLLMSVHRCKEVRGQDQASSSVTLQLTF